MASIVNPLLQRHVERLIIALRDKGISIANPYAGITREDGRYLVIDAVPINGEIVRAAASAEMLNGTIVDDLTSWQAAELAAEIISAVGQSMQSPKA